jgi:hypothetical protein
MNLEELNKKLEFYDHDFFFRLEPVLQKIASKSKALASNLKDCIEKLKASDRYLRAYNKQKVGIKESELSGEEFEIFRKYVRLLRSCTIMCGQENSKDFKELFLEFFSGARLEKASNLN